MAVHNSPQSKCAICFRFHPSWDLHLKCVAHWDRDCSRASPCDVCQVWSPSQWDYVDQTVAREEAKAFLKARGSRPGKRPKISPTDVLGGRPKRPKVSDYSYTSTMSNNVANSVTTVNLQRLDVGRPPSSSLRSPRNVWTLGPSYRRAPTPQVE